MHREHYRWDSPALGRSMELLWYGNWGRPMLIFPTSLGTCSQNEDCGLFREGLAAKVDAGEVQVCSVDAIDGEIWYNRGAHPAWRMHRYLQWERYLLEEVLPLIRHKAQREDVIVYGASWGAFHAMNFALRHPEAVSRVVTFSGMYDLHRMLDGHWDDSCYFNCPTAYVPNYPQDAIDRTRHIGFVLATGEQDHLVQDTRHFAGVLRGKGLNVVEEIWGGVFGHDWNFWAQHLPRFV